MPVHTKTAEFVTADKMDFLYGVGVQLGEVVLEIILRRDASVAPGDATIV